MMRDNIEQFVHDNREEFDRKIPSLKVWAAIDKSLPKQEQAKAPRRIFSIVKIAASILLLLSLGAAGGVYFSQGNASEADRIASQFPEFEKMQNYYTKQVSEKMDLLQQYNYVNPVNEDLIEIDGFIDDLKTQLAEVPRGSEEIIINAMIQNYQTKLEILERILARMEAKTQNTKKNETIDI